MAASVPIRTARLQQKRAGKRQDEEQAFDCVDGHLHAKVRSRKTSDPEREGKRREARAARENG